MVIRIEQYCKRRKDRMKPKRQEDSSCVFAYYFCRGTCHRRDTAEKKKAPKLHRHRSEKRSFEKSRWDDTAGKSSRERQAPAPVCRSQSAAPVMQGSNIPDPLPDGSQDTGGAFRSRVQRPGVRHRSIGAGRIRPMWLRTDLTQVKRDRHTGKP